MSRRYEVFYTYTVDASVRLEADSSEDAIEQVEKMWESEGDSGIKPKTLDYSDFEVLYAKKR